MLAHRGNASIISTLVLIFMAVCIWIVLAPTQLGGQVGYVIVDGNSMEPKFHLGDLVLIRAQSVYQVGDIVTYWNAELNRYVIHRIVRIDLDHFILKGDNNTWLDTYEPSQQEIVGKLWVYIPTVGNAIEWVREPLPLALMVGLLGGIVAASMMIKPSQKKKRESYSQNNWSSLFEGALYLIGCAALVFLGLTIFAFIQPLTRKADGVKYQQDGFFSYSAAGTPGVYDTNTIQSGEPIFPKLTCFLNVGFSYNLTGDSLQSISGTHQLYALVLDEQSGWQRTVPMDSVAAFTGSSYVSISALNLCQIESVVSSMEQQTGLNQSQYTLKIVDHIGVMGMAAGQVINDTFDPSVTFNFDKVHFYLDTSTTTDSPLHSLKQSLAGGTELQPNTISFLGLDLPVGMIRMIALLGLVLTLGIALIVGWLVYDATRQNEAALIRLKYGALIMDVFPQMLEPSSKMIDVGSIDDLAKLAERQNVMILHVTLNFIHVYLVQHNTTTYRYVANDGNPIVEAGTAYSRFANDNLNNTQPRQLNGGRHREDNLENVIDLDEDGMLKAGPAQKEMVRRIRL